MLWIGAHISIAKGFSHAAQATVDIGGNTFQFFSRNPRGSSVKAFEPRDIVAFFEIRKRNCFGPLMAHAPYTMNLAGAREEVQEFARRVLAEDIARMEEIQIDYFNLHPGSHVGSGAEQGIRKIAEALNAAVGTGDWKIRILLETMAGKGTEIGRSFEEIRQILDRLERKELFGVCMDFCHVFSAGYDIVNQPEEVFSAFDRIVGLDRLKAIHLNDSQTPFGANKDRHALLGEGEIGLEAILRLMRLPYLKNLPFYLETPLEDAGHKIEIANLRMLLGQNIEKGNENTEK